MKHGDHQKTVHHQGNLCPHPLRYHPSLASGLVQGLGRSSILLWALSVRLYWFPLVLSVLLSCPYTAVPRPSRPASHLSPEDKKDSGHTVHLAFFSAACRSLLIAGWLGGFSQYQQQPRQERSPDPWMVPLLVFSISQHCEFCAVTCALL